MRPNVGMSLETCRLLSRPRSALPQHKLGGTHVLKTVVSADYDNVLLGIARGQGDAEVVVFRFRIGNLAHGLDVLPVLGVNGVFRAFYGRKAVQGTEGYAQLAASEGAAQILNGRRRGVHLETGALLGSGQRLIGR